MKLRPLMHWFLASVPLLALRSNAAVAPSGATPAPEPWGDPVKLRPLNLPSENLFAGHRSHGSHASHRSSSGGGYATSPTPDPQRAAPGPSPSPSPPPPSPAPQTVVPDTGNQPVDPGRPAAVSPNPGGAVTPAAPALSLAEKRRLQIMRVQIALTSLGLFKGRIDGVLTDATKSALKSFQLVKGLPESGLMTTDTLNALGVPAVQ